MCQGESDAARREKRVRGFLETVQEIAREAAREEVGKALAPGAIVRVPSRVDRPTFEIAACPNCGERGVCQCEGKPGKHLSVHACNRLKAMRLLLKAGDPKIALTILDDVMGW